MQHTFALTSLLVCAILNLPLLPHAAPLELDVLRQQYDKLYAERVTGPHETAVAELNTKFTAALDTVIDSAKQAGKLDDVLAIQADRKSIEEKRPLPTEDAEVTPEALKKLRAIYREQSAALAARRTANADELVAPYTVKLEELEVTLTRADRIEDATLVRKYRESLALATPPAAPTVMVGVAPTTVPTAPARKGDDRKAAEWVLSFAVPGGDTFVSIEGARGAQTCRTLAELPAGDLVVTSFNISGFQKPLPKPVTNEDTMVLTGLQRLREFQFNKAGVTDDGLRFAATCPELKALRLHNLEVTDDVFRHFAGSKKLTEIVFNNCKAINGIGFHHIAAAELDKIEIQGSGFNDEGLPYLAGFRKLRTLNLSATRVTDDGLRTLTAAKSLVNLNLSNTDVTPAGLLPLQGIKLTALSFGRTKTWDTLAPSLPALASAFPEVEETVLPRGGTYSALSIEPLVAAFPKLRILEIQESKFEPGALAAISKFTKLEQLNLRLAKVVDADLGALADLRGLQHLNLNDTGITDAALVTLAEFKALNSLMINNTGTTTAGLETFRKVRTDVKIQDRYYVPPR